MMKWDWPKLKSELTNLSSSLKLQSHLAAPDYAPCQQTTIDLAIEQYEEVRADLDLALKYLREGKARFTPNTTNSFVDDLLAKYPRVSG